MKQKQPSCICSYCYLLNIAFIKNYFFHCQLKNPCSICHFHNTIRSAHFIKQLLRILKKVNAIYHKYLICLCYQYIPVLQDILNIYFGLKDDNVQIFMAQLQRLFNTSTFTPFQKGFSAQYNCNALKSKFIVHEPMICLNNRNLIEQQFSLHSN